MGENCLWQLEHRRRSVGRILAAIADAPPGGVLVHCAAGEDRTGLVVALALAIAGVAREEIAADYALSASAVAPMLEEHLAVEPDPSRRDRLRSMYRFPPEAMMALLADLDRRHGGVAGYLRSAGAGEDTQDRLRTRLVGSD